MNERTRLIRILHPEITTVSSLSWSPDSTRLAIGTESGKIQVLTTEGQELWQKDDRGTSISAVSWSPNGKYIASSFCISERVSTVRIRNAVTGQSLLQKESQVFINAISWSLDSQQLAYVGTDEPKSNWLKIVDVSTGQEVLSILDLESSPSSVVWLPDGKRLMVGLSGRTILLVTVQDGFYKARFEGHKGGITSISCSSDGQTLVSADDRGVLRVWDVQTGQFLFQIRGHDNWISSVVWSPDGSFIASGSRDETIRIWAAKDGNELLQLDQASAVRTVAFAPNDSCLASGLNDGTVRLWDVSALVEPQPTSHEIDRTLSHYITRQAATVGRQIPNQTVEFNWVPSLNEAEKEYLGTLASAQTNVLVQSIDVSSNGYIIAIGTADGQVQQWDLKTREQIWASCESHEGTIYSIAIAKDGVRLASASGDGILKIWDTRVGSCLLTISNFIRIRSINHSQIIAWAPDSNRIAFATQNKQIQIWDISANISLAKLPLSNGVLCALRWSPDSCYLAVASDESVNKEKAMRVLEVSSGKHLQSIGNHEVVWDIAWSPSSRYLASGHHSGDVNIWEINNGKVFLLQKLAGHSAPINSVAWSPDGDLLASTANEVKIHIWEPLEGKKLHSFSTDNYCKKLLWSPLRTHIISLKWHDYKRGHFVCAWDIRHLIASQTTVTDLDLSNKPLPLEFRTLPVALAQLHRLNCHPPLAWVHDLLSFTKASQSQNFPRQWPLKLTSTLTALRQLHWSEAARIGLVALLLYRISIAPEWTPPSDTTPTQLRDALANALKGDPIPVEAPSLPISQLQETAKRIDDRLLTLLTLLGEDAVAADPGLPLKLLPNLNNIPPLSDKQRQLLGLKVRFGGNQGRATGSSPGADRARIGGVETGRRTDWNALLPSQLALPDDVLAYRHDRGELLFRAREVAEPPRLRPTVILLDTSPPAWHMIETTVRLAAFVVARTLYQASVPTLVVTSGGLEQIIPIETAADLVEIWTQRTLKVANVPRSLKLAHTLCQNLRTEGSLEPIILLLTHPWFGADEALPKIANLQGLFVQYPEYMVRPVLADQCDRWETVSHEQVNGLEMLLGHLMG